jgi:phosphotransferase family enzyme
MTWQAAPRQCALLSWADTALTATFSGARITAKHLLPSRTGLLWRLRVRTAAGERCFYLKGFEQRSWEVPNLETVAASFDHARGISFVEVVATAPALDAVLLGEADGMSLIDFRRRAVLRFDFSGLSAVWERAGRWLRTLHWETLKPRLDTTAGERGASYITTRLNQWAQLDPAKSALAQRAVEAVGRIAGELESALLTPCHGDVSAGNILVGDNLTFVDFDDCRFDLPALDLSQAIMEIAEYSRIASILRLPWIGPRCERSLRAGYGLDRWPSGPAWLLPHLRNLSVYLVTLAPKRSAPSEAARYRRTWRELERTLATYSSSQIRSAR